MHCLHVCLVISRNKNEVYTRKRYVEMLKTMENKKYCF